MPRRKKIDSPDVPGAEPMVWVEQAGAKKHVQWDQIPDGWTLCPGPVTVYGPGGKAVVCSAEEALEHYAAGYSDTPGD
ncbi:MAG: hypothetical protein OEV92_03950 [Nitrospinota bacterium]|nr:hypothetical protein [Nitrospinota bacterium]